MEGQPGAFQAPVARLTNLTHSEVFQFFPVPCLPPAFGGAPSQEGQRGAPAASASTPAVEQQIAHLLKEADIRYLSLKGVPLPQRIAQPSARRSALLSSDPGLFQSTFNSPHRGNHRSAPEQSAPPVGTENGTLHHMPPGAPDSAPPLRADPWASSAHEDEPLMRPRTKKRRSAKTPRPAAMPEDAPPPDRRAALLALIEQLLEPEAARGDRLGACLTREQLAQLADAVASLRAEGRLADTPVAPALKLVLLLDRHVRRGTAPTAPNSRDDLADSGDAAGPSLALEAAQLLLSLLATPGMPAQLYVEEVIEGLLAFLKSVATHTVFPAFDPMYTGHAPPGARSAGGDNKGGAPGEAAPPSKARPAAAQKGSAASPSPGAASVLARLCVLYELVARLLALRRLPASGVLQLGRLALATLGVDNLPLLHLKAIALLAAVFRAYPEHRLLLTDDVVALLWRVPAGRRGAAPYHVPGEAAQHIGMTSAALLHAVQACAVLPRAHMWPDEEQRARACAAVYEGATAVATHFWRAVVLKWGTLKGPDSADLRGALDALVADLRTTLNAPEFPAAGLLLQVLASVLLSEVGVQSRDPGVRGLALDVLGTVAAQLQADAVADHLHRPWLLFEYEAPAAPPGDCEVCQRSVAGVRPLRCTACPRLFHSECLGGAPAEGARWRCALCECKEQLAALGVPASAGPGEGGAEEQVLLVQQALLNYLAAAARADPAVASAREFFLCQWFQDAPQEELRLYEARLDAGVPPPRPGPGPPALSRVTFVQVARALGQKRPLQRGLAVLRNAFLGSLQESTPTLRAKGLRALGGLVAADPAQLADREVAAAVEGRFLDTAISVREAAMELVGHYVTTDPNLANQYYEHIAGRILDLGVSVRKRVIRILRAACIEPRDSPHRADACVRLLSRVNDEEASIQDLVVKTFSSLLFSPLETALPAPSGAALSLEERCALLLDLLRRPDVQQPLVSVIKRCLTPEPSAGGDVAAVRVDPAVRAVCEAMCRHLLQSVILLEECSPDDTAALPPVLLLNAFCEVDPLLCAPPTEPLRAVVTLQPYLQTQASSREAAQLCQALLDIFSAVLPLARPPSLLAEQLDKTLRDMVQRQQYLTVVHAAIRCLCALGAVAEAGATGLTFLLTSLFDFLKKHTAAPADARNAATIGRCLYSLGVLCRYGAYAIRDTDAVLNFESIMVVFRHYLASSAFDVKQRALQGLGYLFTVRPRLMLAGSNDKLLHGTLATTSDKKMKIQTLRNFHDFLLCIEDDMKASSTPQSRDTHAPPPEPGGAAAGVPDTAGAADKLDAGIAGGIIQAHWARVLERCTDPVPDVRHAALKVVEAALRQGLVHPMTAVPPLVALGADAQAGTAKLAHALLASLYHKHPDFLESRLGDGLEAAFRFQAALARAGEAGCASAGVARVYQLCRATKGARNKFLHAVVHKFDTAAHDLPFLAFCAESLAALPWVGLDEPLACVHAVNRAIQLRGGAVLGALKTALLGAGPVGAAVRVSVAAAEREAEEAAINIYSDVEPPPAPSPGTPPAHDDLAGLPPEDVAAAKADSDAAVALSLLLLLKRFLKMAYALSDERCRAFSPTEPAKSGDAAAKRDAVGDFDASALPLAPVGSSRDLWHRYQVFKKLMKEDVIDYGAFTIAKSRKRGSAARIETPTGEATLGEGASGPAPGLPGNKRARAKSMGQTKRRTKRQRSEDESCDDDSTQPEFNEEGGDWSSHRELVKTKGRRKRQAADKLRASM